MPKFTIVKITCLLLVVVACKCVAQEKGEKPSTNKTGLSLAAKEHWSTKLPGFYSSRIAFSDDGATIALTRISGEIRFYKAATGEEEAVWESGERNVTPVFQPGKTRIAYKQRNAGEAGAYEIKLIDYKTLREVWSLKNPYQTDLWTYAFSPDGNFIAAGGQDKIRRDAKVKVWKIGERVPQKSTPVLATSKVNATCFSTDGKLLAFTLERVENGKKVADLEIWDVAKWKQFRTIRSAYPVSLTSGLIWFSSNSKLLIATSDDDLRLWDLEKCDLLLKHRYQGKLRNPPSYSARADLVANCFRNQAGAGTTASVFSPRDPKRSLTLQRWSGSCTISPNGRLLVSVDSFEKTLRAWVLDGAEP